MGKESAEHDRLYETEIIPPRIDWDKSVVIPQPDENPNPATVREDSSEITPPDDLKDLLIPFDWSKAVKVLPPTDERKPKHKGDLPSKKNGSFSLYSSFGPESSEVIEMKKAYEKGDPIVLYEFMQGMVDYGRHNTPPPRIYIEYRSGQRVVFNGHLIEMRAGDPITAIEFTNNGPGLSPEDSVIIRHGGNGSASGLGIHGRGLTVAITFLAQKGVKTKIISNFKDREWEAESSLSPTESGVTDVLHVNGQWNGQAKDCKTVIRMENPDPRLIEQLSQSRNYFLYANPHFPDAIIVPKTESETIKPSVIAVDVGTVMCLEGVVDNIEMKDKEKKSIGWSHIFVDGLRLPLPYRVKSILPWSISGLSSPKQWVFEVKRSHDSSCVYSNSLQAPIGVALRQIEDESILRSIIKTSLENPEEQYLELKSLSGYVEAQFSQKTQEIIRNIWESGYGNALLDNSKKCIEKFKGEYHGTKIIYAPLHLLEFLKEAGIQTFEAKLRSERNFEDEAFLSRMIKTAFDDPSNKYLGLENLPFPPSDRTKEIVRKIWASEYENALIDDSSERIEKYKDKCQDRKVIYISNRQFFSFLQSSGVKTLSSALGLMKSTEMNELNGLELPSAYASDNLERLMAVVAKEGGEVKLVILNGKKYLQIKLPGLLTRAQEFNGITENPTGRLVRVAAIMAHILKVDCHVFSLGNDAYHEIQISSETSIHDQNTFLTPVTISTFERGRYPDYESYEEDFTYVLLSGDQINELGYPTRLEKLIEIFLNALKELKKKLNEMGIRRKKKDKTEEAQSDMSQGEAQENTDEKKDTKQKPKDGKPVKASVIAHQVIGQIPIAQEVVERVKTQDDNNETNENICPVGYYQKSIGTAFSFDAGRENCSWSASLNWVYADIPQKRLRKFSSKIVLNNFQGDSSIYVLTGHKIAAFEADPEADVEFFRDVRTGIYSLRGRAKKIIYYTQLDDDQSYAYNPPLPEEQESIIGIDLLIPEWRRFIEETNCNPALTTLTKVQLAMRKWTEMFKYLKDDSVHDQISGHSREVVATKILNTSRGICNVSATGFALLLRALGMPSRVCVGYWKQGGGYGGDHMWVEFWDNKRWVQIESEVGIGNEESNIPQSRRIVASEEGEVDCATENDEITESIFSDLKEKILERWEQIVSYIGTYKKKFRNRWPSNPKSKSEPKEKPEITDIELQQLADQIAARWDEIKSVEPATEMETREDSLNNPLLQRKGVRYLFLTLLVGSLIGLGYANRDRISGVFNKAKKEVCMQTCDPK